MSEYIYTIMIVARDYAKANQLAAALSGNPADAQTFTEEYALPLMRDDGEALAIEVPCKQSHYDAACSFRDGGNPFGLPAQVLAAYRASMDIDCGGLESRGALRQWVASLGYEVAK